MNFIEAMKIAEGVLAQYKIDQLKWWKRLDGTPMLNDLAVRFSEAFMEEATDKKDSIHRCKVGRVCDPETCTRALIEDEPNVSTSTSSSAQADVAAVGDAVHTHKWDQGGERCEKCGDKDWINSACSIPDADFWLAVDEDGLVHFGSQYRSIANDHINDAIDKNCPSKLRLIPVAHALKSAAPTAQPQADGVKP